MKHLISATLSLEAATVWQQWPRGQRSRMLSVLIADEGNLQMQSEARSLRIGYLAGNLATHRRRLVDFLASNPPIDDAYSRMFADIIEQMNDDVEGSIHYDPNSLKAQSAD